MNNSKIIYENPEGEDRVLSSQEKYQGKLTQLIEAINAIEKTEEWQKLKKVLLDDIVVSLEKQIKDEVDKKEISLPELYRLQGQLLWAKKYVDLKKLSDVYRQQLEGISNLIKHEKRNSTDGAV